MTNEWRDIQGFPGCQVSSVGGRVRSTLRGAPFSLKPFPLPTGYLRVTTCRDRKHYTAYVHTLVLEAFYGPRPLGMEARHLDGDRNNNAATNLAWGTRSENQLDNVRLLVNPNARKTHCPSGHPYDQANTRVGLSSSPGGSRHCRTCARIRKAARRKSNKKATT